MAYTKFETPSADVYTVQPDRKVRRTKSARRGHKVAPKQHCQLRHDHKVRPDDLKVVKGESALLRDLRVSVLKLQLEKEYDAIVAQHPTDADWDRCGAAMDLADCIAERLNTIAEFYELDWNDPFAL